MKTAFESLQNVHVNQLELKYMYGTFTFKMLEDPEHIGGSTVSQWSVRQC